MPIDIESIGRNAVKRGPADCLSYPKSRYILSLVSTHCIIVIKHNIRYT